MTQWPRQSLSMKDGAPMHSISAGVATSHILEEPSSVLMKLGESSLHRRINYASRALPNYRRLYVNTYMSTDLFMSGNADIAATLPVLSVMGTSTFVIAVMIRIQNLRGLEVRDLDHQFWRASHAGGAVVPFLSQKDATNTPTDQLLNANRSIIVLRVSHLLLVIFF